MLKMSKKRGLEENDENLDPMAKKKKTFGSKEKENQNTREVN